MLPFLIFASVAAFCSSFEFKGNNACKRFKDYFHAKTSENCWFNPDVDLTTPELIQKYAGYAETYRVITEDGYILTMFRIPRRNPKGVVFLMHPLYTDSKLYMIQGNQSTALLLWQAGYDIWLGNQRGTYHSEGHVSLPTSSFEYWNYSFHETGLYDISSMIRFVRAKTGSKVWYFGHSLGTTNALVYASLRPEEARDSIETFMLASTSVYYKHSTSYTVNVLPLLEGFLSKLSEVIQFGNTIPLISTLIQITRILTRIFPIIMWNVNVSLQFNLGVTPGQADPALLNFDMATIIRDCSAKLGFHYLQIMKLKDRFQMYDYGPERNLELYGIKVPPLYPIWNITVPVFLISSTNDALTTLRDSDYLYKQLPAVAKIYKPLHISGFNHADYHIGKDRRRLLVDNLLRFMTNARFH